LDCISPALQCANGVCSCLVYNGYSGETCSHASLLTIFGRVVNATAVALLLLMAVLTIKMMKAYFLPKIFPMYDGHRSKKIYVTSANSMNSTQSADAGRVHKNVKLNAKDHTLLTLLLYITSALFLNFQRLFTLTFDTERTFEFATRRYTLVFVFLLLNFTQLHMGFAWMETALKCSKLGFLKKHIKGVKRGINAICIVEVLLAFLCGLKGKFSLAGALFQLMVLLGSIVIIFGGRYLTKKMLNTGASEIILREAKAIKKAFIRMSIGIFSHELAVVLMIKFQFENGWISNIANLILSASSLFYSISLLVYLDRRGLVFPFANREAISASNSSCSGEGPKREIHSAVMSPTNSMV